MVEELNMRRRFMNHSTTWDYSNYLTIEAIEDVSVLFDVEVQWTTNGINWKTSNRVIAKSGQLVSIKGNIMQEKTLHAYWNDGAYNLKGNIMSLLFGDDAKEKTSMLGYNFNSLFSGSNVITVEKGFLPATELSSSCYSHMFLNCNSLTTAPELPATTLANNCYERMFEGCTNLVNAPALHATVLWNSCYYGMFYNCSKLNNITMLATKISASDCLHDWVKGVASTGTFVKHPDMTSLPRGDNGIPNNWLLQDTTDNPEE